jgi:flagellar biosynthesis/type III secretory pathway protein FliH
MTAVIKSGTSVAALKVRALGDHQTSGFAPPPDTELLELRREREAALRRAADLEADVERLEAERAHAYDEGREAGWSDGLAAGQERAEASLVRLEAGVAAALASYDAEISSLQRLAPLLAREGLEKIVGDISLHSVLLQQAVRRQLDSLDGRQVIRVEVSREDFGDPERLAVFAQALCRPDLSVAVGEDLKSGDCRIKLTLGALEVGLHQQWSQLGAVLTELSEPEALA